MLSVGQGITGANNERARLALGANQNAISLLGVQAQNQNQRYANDVNTIQANHNNRVQRFRDTPASFGQRLGDMGLALAGNAAGSAIGGGISRIGAASANGGGSPGRSQAFGELQRVGR